MTRTLVVLAIVAACSDPPSVPSLRIERAEPDHAPVRGGTQIEIVGSGFADEADRPRVLVGGREAPLVIAVDDTTLQVVVPPGEQPGDAELVVFDARGSASATGLFHYSTPPTLVGVTPAKVVYTSATTELTVTGSGFRDESAGDVTILVDGQPVTNVNVIDDSTLTFFAPPGPPMVQPTIEIVDARGHATRPRAFRYVPSERPGLLLFPPSGEVFAVFYDPSDRSILSLPWVAGATTRFTSVIRDEQGEYWAIDRSLRFGRLDMRAQRIVEPVPLQQFLYPAMVSHGTRTFAIDRASLAFGSVDLTTGGFTRIGTSAVNCCGSFGIAHDGTKLYVTHRGGGGVQLTAIDPETGELGMPVQLVSTTPFLHVEEMRFFQGTLYAASRDGAFVTIDPATGQVTTIPIGFSIRFNAMEIVD